MNKILIKTIIFTIVITLTIFYVVKFWGIDVGRVMATYEAEKWGYRVASRGSGRFCSNNAYDYDYSVAKYISKQDWDSFIASLNESNHHACRDIKLVRTTYFAEYDTVSAIYRCDKGVMVMETQVAVRLLPSRLWKNTWDNDCVQREFPKHLNVPIGELTMFSTP